MNMYPQQIVKTFICSLGITKTENTQKIVHDKVDAEINDFMKRHAGSFVMQMLPRQEDYTDGSYGYNSFKVTATVLFRIEIKEA